MAALFALAGGRVLGLVARHRQRRLDPRVRLAVPASVDGRPAVAVDLTPAGAGIESPFPATVGDTARVTLALHDVAGVRHEVALPAEIRHCGPVDGGHLIGVRFLPGPPEAEDLLLEHCAVVGPWTRLRGRGHSPIGPATTATPVAPPAATGARHPAMVRPPGSDGPQ